MIKGHSVVEESSAMLDLPLEYIVLDRQKETLEFDFSVKLALTIFLAITIILSVIVHRRINSFLERKAGKFISYALTQSQFAVRRKL